MGVATRANGRNARATSVRASAFTAASAAGNWLANIQSLPMVF
jgi:hypothetical protein